MLDLLGLIGGIMLGCFLLKVVKRLIAASGDVICGKIDNWKNEQIGPKE